MAQKPRRECRALGCHNLTRDTYCEAHRKSSAERHRHYDKYQRDKWAAAFYKSEKWKRARLKSMEKHHWLCQDCLARGIITTAEMVHHIKPLRLFPELALVQENLRPLCNKCHAKYKDPPGV